MPLHEIQFIPHYEEIILEEEHKPGETKEVQLHDGSYIRIKKLDKDYDPTDRVQAIKMLQEARDNLLFITGLIYIDEDRADFFKLNNLPEEPLVKTPVEKLRPSKEVLDQINQSLR